MKRLALVLIVLVLAAPDAFAQTPAAAGLQSLPDDPGWSRVAALARGDEIEVDAGRSHAVRCMYSGETGHFLFCDPKYDWPGRGELRFDRSQIATVRQSHPLRNRRILMAAMAAGGGIALGLHNQTLPEKDQVLYGILGAGMGAGLGYPIAILASGLIPGDIIYRGPGGRDYGAQKKGDRFQPVQSGLR